MELVGKSALAATISWVIAYTVMAAQSPAFAPFSAVLIIQVTVYQSLLQALRYLAAVCGGVVLQGALGFLLGPQLWTFALVALVALIIGRWRHLGVQGTQVTTAAFFAFSTYAAATTSSQGLTHLSQIILLVLIGCGVGVAVNVLVFPPLRYRSAEYGIRSLAQSLCNLVSDIYPALREEGLDEDRTHNWRRRADDLAPLVSQARAAAETAQESLAYHPRRLLRWRQPKPTFEGYRALVDSLERVAYQIGSLVRTLDHWTDEEHKYHQFLTGYGDFIAAVSGIAHQLAQVDEDHLTQQVRELSNAIDEAQQLRDGLAEESNDQDAPPLPDPTRPSGVLIVEATRLMEEFQHTGNVLQRIADAATKAPQRNARTDAGNG